MQVLKFGLAHHPAKVELALEHAHEPGKGRNDSRVRIRLGQHGQQQSVRPGSTPYLRKVSKPWVTKATQLSAEQIVWRALTGITGRTTPALDPSP
ncbi:MAG: hypothetical protein NTZ56_13305 [Acidobacteria bacterium]|nr:hypothetical protein [Acidobacteriota bacterium]